MQVRRSVPQAQVKCFHRKARDFKKKIKMKKVRKKIFC